jgi:8-amino-7-oxononanoate synthase
VFEEELKGLKRKGLLRSVISRASPQGPSITLDGKKYINFSSNDYLGFANRPEIIEAAIKASQRYGVGAGSSRLLAGGSDLHKKLEERISEFKSVESAILFNSGYAANTGIIPSLAFDGDVILSDEMNHASIVDGCRLSKAKTVVYRHGDMFHLQKLMKTKKARRKIVVTDSVFSMDGDIAPLKEIGELCKRYDSLLYVDDAHGTGVLGNGRGALAHFGMRPEPWIIQMGTFSKALGSFGAFAAGSRDIIEWIYNTSRSLIFSTALPSCLVAASLSAILLIEKDSASIKKLWDNRERLIKGIRDAGYDILGSETPIIPLKAGDIKKTLRLSHFLSENGIYAAAIRPPSVREPRIRITVSAAHTKRHLHLLIGALKRSKKTRNN